MTETEINQAVAEALGRWLNYYRDLNACAEMENCLSPLQKRVYAQALRKVLGFHNHTYFDWIHATAPQRCEAFLKTIGKWKE